MRKKLKSLGLLAIGLVIGLLLGVVVSPQAGDITGTGIFQGDLYTFLSNTVTLANELRTDHATNKTTVDESRTAIVELIDDHATFKTAVDENNTLVSELLADHATFKTAVDEANTLVSELRADHATFKTAVDAIKLFRGNLQLSDGGIAIGTDTAKVKTAATINYTVDGVFYTKGATDDFWTLSGTTVTSGNANKYLLCIDSAGAASIVEGTQAASAASVVLPSAPASKCVVGILQVETTGDFIPGTTALSAGTVTDTYTDGYAPALIGDAPATITATVPTAGPATLSASVPTAGPATLTATDPTASAGSITASALSLTGL
jgi:hypothetical protein